MGSRFEPGGAHEIASKTLASLRGFFIFAADVRTKVGTVAVRRSMRAGIVMLCAAGLSLGMSGCAADVSVDYTATTATVSVSDTLVVDFGVINSSVGDNWVITAAPDSAVLGGGVADSTYLGDEGSTGGSNALVYRFPAVAAGTTVIEFEYQFRGSVPEDAAEQETARIEVTVK